jgi:hypothetical protein
MTIESAIEQAFKELEGSVAFDGTKVSIPTLLQGLGKLAQTNWDGAIKAIEAGHPEQDMAPLSAILSIIGNFIPPVAIANDVVQIIVPVVEFIMRHTPKESTEKEGNDAIWTNIHARDHHHG